MAEVYYIEDDADIAEAVREYLQERGFHVSVFGTVSEAMEAFERALPAIALVDWNLPDGRGDQLCRRLRASHEALPILFLTVRGEDRDIVSGFACGADDYVVKPFSLEVLLSRMTALLRRSGTGQLLSCGEIALDEARMEVTSRGKRVAVSQVEYQLLRILLQNRGRTVTRERLLERLWDQNGNFVNDNTLTVTVKRLREKLGQPSCIRTVRSFGYRMEELP